MKHRIHLYHMKWSWAMKRLVNILIILGLLLAGTVTKSIGATRVPKDDPPPQSTSVSNGNEVPIYMPLIMGFGHQYSVSGKVADSNNRPVAGVTITDQTGLSAVTDMNGLYTLNGLYGSEHALAPSKSGLVFEPSLAQVNLDTDSGSLDFTALQECSNGLENGGFEDNDGWTFPATEYTAGYSTAKAHNGDRSARTGMASDDNIYSYSSTRQKVHIPSDASSATLKVWLYPQSGEAADLALPEALAEGVLEQAELASDVQYVLVLDQYGNILKNLLWTRSNAREWRLYDFNLKMYSGRTIIIHIGTFNDGLNGRTTMYVDDADLEICPEGATPEPTPTGTPGTCENYLENSSFENNKAWEILPTARPARYSSKEVHSGERAMLTGFIKGESDLFSYSDAVQEVSIPKNSTSAVLKLWKFQRVFVPSKPGAVEPQLTMPPIGQPLSLTAESADVQYVLILDQYNNVLDAPIWERKDTGEWQYDEVSLKKYAGKTIQIQFGTFNNGISDMTQMFVDDIVLDACPSTPVTPTPSPTPGPTETPAPPGCDDYITNNGFEKDTGWYIPLTEFSADYSTTRAYNGNWSMRTGITSQAHNRYSYSDAAQTVSIPASADNVELSLWVYPSSSDAADLALAEIPMGQTFGTAAMASDVQYLLILDRYGNWIDTLLWQRSNAQTWKHYTYDLDSYAGKTIRIQFGTYNTGWGGVTSMYVDDVFLEVCD
jgi:hypothetical protein